MPGESTCVGMRRAPPRALTSESLREKGGERGERAGEEERITWRWFPRFCDSRSRRRCGSSTPSSESPLLSRPRVQFGPCVHAEARTMPARGLNRDGAPDRQVKTRAREGADSCIYYGGLTAARSRAWPAYERIRRFYWRDKGSGGSSTRRPQVGGLGCAR